MTRKYIVMLRLLPGVEFVLIAVGVDHGGLSVLLVLLVLLSGVLLAAVVARF